MGYAVGFWDAETGSSSHGRWRYVGSAMIRQEDLTWLIALYRLRRSSADVKYGLIRQTAGRPDAEA